MITETKESQSLFLLGLFGHGIGHSLSPLIHSYWFSRYEIDARYQLFEADPTLKTQMFHDILSHLHGVNITIPYKEFVFHQLGSEMDRVTAVNTLYRLPDGRMTATNTDVLGGLDVFKEKGVRRQDNIVILGNGGTTRALIEIFFQLQVSCVHVVQRRAKPWHADYKEMLVFHDWDSAEALIAEADILINTVPVLPLKGTYLISKTLFCDYSYGRSGSFLRQQAAKVGCEIISGVEFLLRQAQHSFKYWFNLFPEITPELRSLLRS